MLLKKLNPPKNMIFEVTGGQWPPIWKMKKTGEANIARELCLNFYQNRTIFRHICPRYTIFITNVSQKIPPFIKVTNQHIFLFSWKIRVIFSSFVQFFSMFHILMCWLIFLLSNKAKRFLVSFYEDSYLIKNTMNLLAKRFYFWVSNKLAYFWA